MSSLLNPSRETGFPAVLELMLVFYAVFRRSTALADCDNVKMRVRRNGHIPFELEKASEWKIVHPKNSRQTNVVSCRALFSRLFRSAMHFGAGNHHLAFNSTFIGHRDWRH